MRLCTMYTTLVRNYYRRSLLSGHGWWLRDKRHLSPGPGVRKVSRGTRLNERVYG